MTDVEKSSGRVNRDLGVITVRIRSDQRKRLEMEQRARGTRLADVIRDNIDLALAVKEELAQVVEGEFDESDPQRTPKLVHSLLYKVEERILDGLDNMAIRLEKRLNDAYEASGNRDREHEDAELSVSSTVDRFVSAVADGTEYPTEVWVGAFLEIVPRLELVGAEKLGELKKRGEAWLDEQGYYVDAGNRLAE